MSQPRSSLTLLALSATLALAGCVTPGGGLVTTGNAATAVGGAAGGAQSVNADAALERCAAPLGTLAVDDGRGKEWYASFGASTQVTTIEPLIRLAVQQSNCFVITAIGNNRTEGRISAITDRQRNSGEFRAGSRQQKGQRVAADYYLEPSIIINNETVGGLASSLGARLGGIAGSLAGSLQSRQSVVTMTMFDIRSGVQLAISEGNATATNYGAALGAFGGAASGRLAGFSRTPEGKASVAAFIDAYNKMVVALRQYKAQEVQGGLGRGGQLKVGR